MFLHAHYACKEKRMFTGRINEIERLNGFYEGDECGVAVVSGSYGVGKTTLLRHFSEDKTNIYIEAYETTGKHQCQLIGGKLGLEPGATATDICEKITELATVEKQLVIIDQYPNIVKGDAEFDKVLYEYVTGVWHKLPIKLVLCSDAFVLIDKYVKGKKAKWKDTIQLDLVVEPFGFYDSLSFFSDASPADAAFLYGITGGIAYNLVRAKQIYESAQSDNKTKEVAQKLFMDKDSAVGINPEKVMATELRELAYYNYMLTTLAKGISRVNQISAEVDKPKDVVVPYLNSLMAIGVCTKETAITELNNRKKTRYSIINTSTLFWYRFIVPNFDLYAAGKVDELWDKVEEDIDDYMKQVFISMCSEYLENRSEDNQLPFTVEETGNWWVNDDEAGTTDGFDLVALGKSDGKSATIFCQCFYNHSEIEVAQLKALIEKTKQLKRQGDVFYLVFSKSGFNENAITISSAIKNIMLITLDEMR